MSLNTIYIAGPMRGYPGLNFAAFDKARDFVNSTGEWEAVSPADLDRLRGHTPAPDEVEAFEDIAPENVERVRKNIIKRDVSAVLDCDAILLLPGWEDSQGAQAELCVAKWAEKDVYYYHPELGVSSTDWNPPCPSESGVDQAVTGEDILDEALRLTTGDRNNTYGPPTQDFDRTAQMWAALKGVDFCAADVAMFMICLKLSRETHMSKRDSWVDMAGYARCGWLCRQAEQENNNASEEK
jgi:hypothetical protein